MQKNKFISLLKKLTKQEVKGFHKHLKVEHKREKVALRVFEYFIRFYPDFEQEEKLRLEYAYEKIYDTAFTKTEQESKNLRNKASQLGIWLKEFLIKDKVQHHQALQQSIWLSILQEKGLKKEFSRKATEFYHQTRSAAFRTPMDALPNWMASYFHREHLSGDKALAYAKTIQQCTETMIDSWEVLRLKMACEMSLVSRTNEQAPIPKEAKPIEYHQVGLSTLKDTYEALLGLTDSGEARYFDRLESLLTQQGHHIDPKELEGIIQYAYNYTADQSRRNQDAMHYERTHRLNKISLTYGAFTSDGDLDSVAFGNFVTVACLTKDFEWASRFIQDYSHVLSENNRQDATILAKAIIAFEAGNLKEVPKLLEDLVFENPLDTIRAKSLLLRSYYELNADQNVILDTCTYFENMLRRSGKTDTFKAMLAFVLVLKKLVTQKSSKKAIIDSIHKAPKIYSRKWLLEKTVHYKPRYANRNLKK